MAILDQYGTPIPEIKNDTLRDPSPWLSEILRGGPAASAGIPVNNESALRSAAVWACINAIAQDVSKLPLILYQMARSGGKKPATDEPLFDLLENEPNPEMSSMTWRWSMMGELCADGNAYSEIVRNGAAYPLELWPLRSKHMQVWRNPQTERLTYKYVPPGRTEPVILDESQVFHLKLMGDGHIGWSPIRLHREVISSALAQDIANGASMGNYNVPAGVLSIPGWAQMSDTAQQRFIEEYNRKHTGPWNVGKIAIGPDLKFQPFELSAEDQQFVERCNYSDEQICRIFRVPPHIIQDLHRATNNNIEQQALEYVQNCLMTYFRVWECEIQRKLIPRNRKDLKAQFDLKQLLRADTPTRAAYHTAMFNMGAISENEIRAEEGFNSIGPNGNVYYLNGAFVPVELAVQGPPNWREQPEEDEPDDEDEDIEDSAAPQPPSKGEDGPINALKEAFEPLFAAEMRRILKIESDKVSRASKQAGFGEWAKEFYSTQQKYVAECLAPAVTSFVGAMNVAFSAKNTISEALLTSISAQIVANSVNSMREPRDVREWTKSRPEREARAIVEQLLEAHQR